MALVLALIEIQVEGKDGWAKNLPTWKPAYTGWLGKLLSTIFFKKQITGYHVTMVLFVMLIFHLPYVFGVPFTFFHWARTLSLSCMFICLWDILWFVVNPHYTLKKFKKAFISWHVIWSLGLPIDYWVLLFLSLLVLVPFIVGVNGLSVFIWWSINVLLFCLQVFLLLIR